MGRWLDQWSVLENNHEPTLWEWLHPLKPSDFAGKTVLDAGCGNGGNAAIISKYAQSVTGVDLESTTSPLVKEAGNISYRQANLENLDLHDEFDIGFSVGVLHHLDNPDLGFENLVQAVKPGGIVAVWVYSKEGNWLMQRIVEPIKKAILLRLPGPPFRILTHIATLCGYVLAFSPMYFLSLLKWLPYYEYFQFWRSYTYSRNYMNVYDKLNAPTTHWISKPKIHEWASRLEKATVTDFNGVSWRLTGVKQR